MTMPTTPPPADTDWRLWLDVVQFTLYLILGIYLWIVNKGKATNARIEQVERAGLARVGTLETDMDKRLDGHADRLARIEERIGHMPTRESVGKIHSRLDQLQQSQSVAQGELVGIHKTLDLIHQHMLGEAK